MILPPNDKPTLLIFDGDVLAFIAAAAVQTPVQQANGDFTQIARFEDGAQAIDGFIRKFRNAFEAHTPSLDGEGTDPNPENQIIVVLSDPSENWRFEVDTNYKGNRKATITPMLLHSMKDYLRKEYGADHLRRLEADDYVALLMTDPELADFTRIAIGRDKDFKCIPGWHYQMPKSMKEVGQNPEPFYITEPEADRWHMIQSLAGDMTDNIPGCLNIGVTRAARIVDARMLLVPSEGIITRGINKGKRCVRWIEKPADTVWDCIVSNYEKAGLSEFQAVQTAQLTHLLRHGEYNPETAEVVLWTPKA